MLICYVHTLLSNTIVLGVSHEHNVVLKSGDGLTATQVAGIAIVASQQRLIFNAGRSDISS